MASISDYDRVESFTRNLYRDILCHDSCEYEWMQKTAMAGHLMAMGAQKTTVISAFVARVLIETNTDVVTLSKFLDTLNCDGEQVLENIIDMTATEKYEYSPLDLVRKTRKDKNYARYHLFLVHILFKIRSYNRINIALEEFRAKKVRQIIQFFQRVAKDSLTRDLLQQISVEMASVDYLRSVEKAKEIDRKADIKKKNELLNTMNNVTSLEERVKARC